MLSICRPRSLSPYLAVASTFSRHVSSANGLRIHATRHVDGMEAVSMCYTCAGSRECFPHVSSADSEWLTVRIPFLPLPYLFVYRMLLSVKCKAVPAPVDVLAVLKPSRTHM